MLNPGFHSLGIFSGITAAGTQTGDGVALDGLLALTVHARFAWGSGGTSCKLYLQSSIDGGNIWADFACIVFGVATENAILNFSKLTPKLTQVALTDGAMADDTAVDGMIAALVRCKIVTVGTYANSTTLTVSGDAS
jgi:hypothetical protein